MVGGIVVETIIVTGRKRVWVNCIDGLDECAIYVSDTPAARSISEGDSLWRQGDHAMWTPINKPFSDMRLVRVGYSGVKRPETEGSHD